MQAKEGTRQPTCKRDRLASTAHIHPATLAQYIRSHGIAAQVIDGGELWAAHVYAIPTATGIGWETRWEQVPATLRDVREWLGY